MKIAIDARVLNKGITGTGRYLMNILDGLQSVPSNHDYYLFTSNIELFKNSIFKIITLKEPNRLDKVYSPFWLNVILPDILKKHNFDVYFTTNILVPIVDLSKTKRISVVHDVIHKVYKEHYPFSYRAYLDLFLPQSLKESDRVITVSEYSKSDIIKYFKVESGKISVIPANVATNLKPISKEEDLHKEEVIKKYNLPKKFILFVGSIEKRKNIVALLQIIEILQKRGTDIQLVMAGRPGYGFNEFKERILGSNSFVKYLDFVNDEDLVYLYNSAFAFVFPSFYEGFGIPPLEAMQCGVPVIASNTSSLPEVLGEGAILINPNNIDGYVNEIIRLDTDIDYYNQVKERGIKRSKNFSIGNSAKALIEIFDNL